MGLIVNVAAYRFASLTGLVELRGELSAVCRANGLKGSILLSAEGINMFVAGERAGVEALLKRVREVPGLAGIEVKESFSGEVPFNRMLVKVKKEIIAFGVESVDPRRYTSRRVGAKELKGWLDEGQEVVLLDTRNDFEVKTGTFVGAVAVGVDDFRKFPEAVGKLPAEMKGRKVVTFCTGGIRCEKAAPFLEQAGFREVYQLDGGILKYFEECGGSHYEGSCFVFDKRVALNAELKEAGVKQCFVCQAVLGEAELASEKYVEGRSCPQCFVTEEERWARVVAGRNAKLREVMSVLPGSLAYENVRPMSVPLRMEGKELVDFLEGMMTHRTREAWVADCEAGRLRCRGDVVRPGRVMRAGEVVVHTMMAEAEPEVARGVEVVYEDDWLVVVNKPAPLPMHACGRFNRNTLAWVLGEVYGNVVLRAAHRLDADTSGVVVFSKTREVARVVQPQFEKGLVRKRYVAKVVGHPAEREFECRLRLSAEPGPRGVRVLDENGVEAWTKFVVRELCADGTAVVEVEPVTGRTNQIRAHLWGLGMPIVGDAVYLANGKLGEGAGLTRGVGEGVMCLHAEWVEIVHPKSGERVRYGAPLPEWARR